MIPRNKNIGLLILCFTGPVLGSFSASAQSGGVAASEPRFRVVRAISGSKGAAQGGRFIMEDARTIFYIPQDKQVIVYFDWEGPPGHHKFEGLWKNPEGKVSVITDFSFEARDKRFGGYFTLLLSDAVQTGLWALEARVDGESAGLHNFQVLAGEQPPGEAAKSRAPLSPAQIYQRAQSATVSIERYNSLGEKFSVGSGFVLGDDMVVTAFHAIDGAARLRVVFSDGRALETDQVQAWNRRQDWAVLAVPAGSATKMIRAAVNSWSVGDRCYSISARPDGSRVIVDLDLIGKNNYPGAGERLNLSISSGGLSLGAPLMNEYGEVIAVRGGSLLPGAGVMPDLQIGSSPAIAEYGGGSLGVPIHLVSLAGATPMRLSDMKAAGHLTPPLVGKWNYVYGSMGRSQDKKSGLPNLIGEKHEFSPKDGQFALVITWDPKEKRKGMSTIRFYDIHNRPLGESKPTKVDLKPGESRQVGWTVPITTLPPGIYRVDVLIDGEPAWRTFFRMVQ